MDMTSMVLLSLKRQVPSSSLIPDNSVTGIISEKIRLRREAQNRDGERLTATTFRVFAVP